MKTSRKGQKYKYSQHRARGGGWGCGGVGEGEGVSCQSMRLLRGFVNCEGYSIFRIFVAVVLSSLPKRSPLLHHCLVTQSCRVDIIGRVLSRMEDVPEWMPDNK